MPSRGLIARIGHYCKTHGLLGLFNMGFLARKMRAYLVLYDDVRGLISLKYNKSRYDRLYGVETDEAAYPDSLTIDSDNRRFATFYQATPVKLFHRIMRAIPVPLESCHFIDIGSGKGRVLLMASEWPFKSISGYEFARELHDAAVRNVGLFRSPRQKCFAVTPIHGDALAVSLPAGDVVLFMFNPFHEELIARFVERLVSCSGERSGALYVCYVNPVHAAVFEASGAFAVVRRHPAFTIYRAL